MRDALANFARSLLSRKFWLAVIGFAALMAEGRHLEAAAVIGSYLGIEGAADYVERREAAKPAAPVTIETAEEVTVEAETPKTTTARRRKGSSARSA